MAHAKRDIKRRAILVRFEPDQVALIDRMRGTVTRQDWIVGACMGATRAVSPTFSAIYAEPPDPSLPTSGRGNTERGVKGPPMPAEPIIRVSGPGRALPPRPRPIKGYDSQGKPIYR